MTETYKALLREKVEGYKMYNQSVKERLLIQIDAQKEITERQYKKALSLIPEKIRKAYRKQIQYNAIERQIKTFDSGILYFKNKSSIQTKQETKKEAIEYIINKKIFVY